jgi:hypothetical protein
MLDASRLVQADGGRPLVLLSMADVSRARAIEGLRRQRADKLTAALCGGIPLCPGDRNCHR